MIRDNECKSCKVALPLGGNYCLECLYELGQTRQAMRRERVRKFRELTGHRFKRFLKQREPA